MRRAVSDNPRGLGITDVDVAFKIWQALQYSSLLCGKFWVWKTLRTIQGESFSKHRLSFGRTSSNGRLMWLLRKINEESDIQLELEFTGRGAYRKVESLEAVSWNIPNWSLFDNAGLPTTKPRDSALRAVTKEVVGIRVLLTRLLFGDGIPRKLLRRLGQVDLSGTI